jgi:mevalonate kinase
MAFQEPSYMGDFAKALEEGLNLQKQKKQLESNKGDLEKRMTILSSIIPNKTKIDTGKVLKSMDYFSEQGDFKKKKSQEFVAAKERYIEHLENEKERKIQEIMNKMQELRAYYDAQIVRSKEAIDKCMEETDRYVINCNSKFHSNETKLLDTDKSPVIQKLETQIELINIEIAGVDEKIANNMKAQQQIQTLW